MTESGKEIEENETIFIKTKGFRSTKGQTKNSIGTKENQSKWNQCDTENQKGSKVKPNAIFDFFRDVVFSREWPSFFA